MPSSDTFNRDVDAIHPNSNGQRSTGAPLSLFGLLLAAIVLFMGFVSFENYSDRSAIQRHGERLEVEVVNIRKVAYQGHRGKWCDVYGDVLFTPIGWDHSVKLKILLAGCDQDNRAISYALQNHTLPIAYDTTNPALALINFDDEVFREDTSATLKLRILLITCFASIFVFVITLMSTFKKS